MALGERLFDMRQKSGETLQQVADAVGVSKVHIWELEKGRSRKPSFDLVRDLARHFGVSIDVLVGDAEVPDAEHQRIQRIHRDLGALSGRDRKVIEEMVRSMLKHDTGGASAAD